jgi:2'-5' RNA ligase
MAETIRAFIAIELTDELKGILVQIGRELEARIPPGTVRWVKPGAMHLTLVFLGDTPTPKLESIERAMTAAVTGIPPVSLTATGLGCFPNCSRPRVVWVGVDEPAGVLKRLKRALDDELEPLGFKPERRSFSPHLTLGRVNKRATRADAQRLGQVVESATLKDAGSMTADQIHLIRSDLRPAGAVYTILVSIPFSGGSSPSRDSSTG